MITSRTVAGEPSSRSETNSASAEGFVLPLYIILLLVMGLALALSGCRFFASKSNANVLAESKGEAATPAPRDPIAECQSLAPEDPYVDDDEVGERAYAACREAAELAPNDAETLYRLGTSAILSNRPDEAVESFRKAEQLGHCKSLYFLGDDAWHGQQDAASAEAYYKRGAECGDERAAGELFSPEAFAASDRLDLVKALYNADMATLNRVRFASASYVAGFYEALSEQYLGQEFDPCWTTTLYRGGEFRYGLNAAEKGDASNILESLAYENAMPLAFQIFMPEQGSKGLEEFREAERKAGHADLNRLIKSSKCNALLPYKIVKGIEEFAKTKRSLIEVAREAAPQIHSHGDLVDWLRQKNRQLSLDE